MGLLDYYAEKEKQTADETVGEFSVTGFEMASFDTNTLGVEIPVNMRLYEKIKKKDDDPKFVVVEVASGISRSKRRWHPAQLKQIEQFVNNRNPVAYKGHIPAEEDHSAFPEIHAVWLGAKTVDTSDGCKLYLKGYLKTQEIRDEIDLEMVDAVSPRGTIRYRPGKDGILDVQDFSPESIDFTRKSRNGLESRVLTIAGEQVEGGTTVDARDIALISEEELRKHNGLLVKKIEDDARADLETKIGEMTTLAADTEPKLELFGKIEDLLKDMEGENIFEKITNLVNTVETRFSDKMKDFIKETVAKKLKVKDGDLAAKFLARTVGEQIDMRGDLTDEKKKEIEGAVDAAIEADDDFKSLKKVAGEMTDDNEDTEGAAPSFSKSRQTQEDRGPKKVGKTGTLVSRKQTLGV